MQEVIKCRDFALATKSKYKTFTKNKNESTITLGPFLNTLSHTIL